MFGAIAGLVGAGLSFIGGKKNRKSQERMHAQEMHANSPQGIRESAEEAGFNPLTVLGAPRQYGAGYVPQFGNEYAALGEGLMQAANGYEQVQIQKAELDLERQRLEALTKATVMGPDVPGIYGDRRAQTGSNNGSAVSRVGSRAGDIVDAGMIGSTSDVAPGRDVMVTPYTSGPGVTEISNKWTDQMGGPIVVPGADGEPWGIDELGTAVVFGLPRAVKGGWNKLKDKAAEKQKAREKREKRDTRESRRERSYNELYEGTGIFPPGLYPLPPIPDVQTSTLPAAKLYRWY